MKPCNVDSVLQAALEQFEYQAINRLLLAALEEYDHSRTTQKEDVKTPAKMLPSTLCKHCMYTICIFVVNDYNKKCDVENKN